MLEKIISQKLQRLSFVLLPILFIFIQLVLISQEREANTQYKIQYGFGEKVLTTYKLICSTGVLRTFEDNSTKEYTRKVEVFLSFWRQSDYKDGFAEIRTSFDSIRYEYNADNEHYQCSSNDDVFPVCSDFQTLIFPILGSNYYTTISPYFEVAKIDGDILVEKRSSIQGIRDSILKKVWDKANSDESLIFFSDLNKNVVKSGRYAIDSVWKSKFTIPIEGIRFTCDTATTKFYLYDGKNFHIKSEMSLMYPNTADTMFVVGLDKTLASVLNTSKSSGSWDVSISPRGLINLVIGTFETTINYQGEELKFSDIIKTDINCELMNTKRWSD